MTDNITTLIAEARFRSFESDEFDPDWRALSDAELFGALGDALEAAEAERDRYRAALIDAKQMVAVGGYSDSVIEIIASALDGEGAE